MLNELKYILGDSLYYLSIQDFYKKWELKHVDEQKFIESVEKVSGREFDWFFDAWLHDTRVMDYSIQKWHSEKNDDGTYKVFLNIKNLGNRHMPLLVETEFSDGSYKRIWWDNSYWNNEDDFIFDVTQKPVRLNLDPDAQTLDVDYRNNSTKLKSKFIFDWPGMNYKPRDEIVYTWLPSLFYNDIDGYTPGLQIRRSYGDFENQIFKLNHSLQEDSLTKQHNLYWYYEGIFKPVHDYRNVEFNFKAFDHPGLREFKFEINKTKFANGYQSNPKQNYKLGFYFQSNVDTQRTNLFEPGKLSSVYFNHSMKSKYFELEGDISNSISPFSKWNFSKLSFTFRFRQNMIFSSKNIFRSQLGFTHWGVKTRSFAGKIWFREQQLPPQITFKVAGNSSIMMFQEPYLRGKDSFFGFDINEIYHLPSDGNMRGFKSSKENDIDALGSISNEFYFIRKKINEKGYFENSWINTEIAIFSDNGIFYNNTGSFIVSNIGIGIRFNFLLFNKPFYLRFDFPTYLKNDFDSKNGEFFVFSFVRSI